mmetsp:Transcript_53849/g.148456  ORF Transcript_53849/g.148456 Transcript_53849/m.148456 type:complete len:208 (+) Transcript_53849:306-929(+)
MPHCGVRHRRPALPTCLDAQPDGEPLNLMTGRAAWRGRLCDKPPNLAAGRLQLTKSPLPSDDVALSDDVIEEPGELVAHKQRAGVADDLQQQQHEGEAALMHRAEHVQRVADECHVGHLDRAVGAVLKRVEAERLAEGKRRAAGRAELVPLELRPADAELVCGGDVGGHAVARARDEFEELRHREDEVDDLWHEEEQHCLGVVAEDR